MAPQIRNSVLAVCTAKLCTYVGEFTFWMYRAGICIFL